VAPKKKPDVVPPDSQLTALGKCSQDEVEEVTEKDSSSSSQRKRPTKASLYTTAAKFLDFTELFKSPNAKEQNDWLVEGIRFERGAHVPATHMVLL
jgi:hypothetical protein